MKKVTENGKARKYILTFPKCNQGYAFKNYAYSIGVNYDLIFNTSVNN